MRTILRWITLGGKHIPIFDGEDAKNKIKQFRENKDAYKALQSKVDFKKYIANEFKDVKGIEKIYLSKENRHGQWGVYIKGKDKYTGQRYGFRNYETYVPFEKAYSNNIKLLKDNIELAKAEASMWYD